MHCSRTPSSWPGGDLEAWELSLAEKEVAVFLSTRPLLGRRYPIYEDLVQEVFLHWWEQRVKYAEERGASPQTFMRRVVEKKLLDLERREKAEKRRGERYAASLDQERESDEPTTLRDTVPDSNTTADPEQRWQETELRLTIQRVLQLLSPRQRRLAEELSTGTDMAEISRRLRIPRATLYDEVTRIRRVFRDEGLEEFLRE